MIMKEKQRILSSYPFPRSDSRYMEHADGTDEVTLALVAETRRRFRCACRVNGCFSSKNDHLLNLGHLRHRRIR